MLIVSKIARQCAISVVFLLLLSPTLALAQKKITINVDFANSSMLKDSDGSKLTAVPAGLTNTQATAIASKIQSKYEDVYGVGNVTINALTTAAASGAPPAANQTVVISNTVSPETTAGKNGVYGDAGAAVGPALVYLKEFTNDGLDVSKIANYIGETAAHEVAHKIGVAHNGEKGTLMSAGKNVTTAQRLADSRSFTAAESKKILDNSKATGGTKKDAPMPNTPAPHAGAPSSLGWIAGTDPDAATPDPSGSGFDYDDDSTWQAKTNLIGSPALASDTVQVGYINTDGEFFKLADPFATFSDGSTDQMALFGGLGDFGNSADIAIYDPVLGITFDYSTFGENIVLDDVNPYNSSVYLEAVVTYDLSSAGLGTVSLDLDADGSVVGEDTTGGFTFDVPEPALGAAVMLLGVLPRRRSRS